MANCAIFTTTRYLISEESGVDEGFLGMMSRILICRSQKTASLNKVCGGLLKKAGGN